MMFNLPRHQRIFWFIFSHPRCQPWCWKICQHKDPKHLAQLLTGQSHSSTIFFASGIHETFMIFSMFFFSPYIHHHINHIFTIIFPYNPLIWSEARGFSRKFYSRGPPWRCCEKNWWKKDPRPKRGWNPP